MSPRTIINNIKVGKVMVQNRNLETIGRKLQGSEKVNDRQSCCKQASLCAISLLRTILLQQDISCSKVNENFFGKYKYHINQPCNTQNCHCMVSIIPAEAGIVPNIYMEAPLACIQEVITYSNILLNIHYSPTVLSQLKTTYN